MGPMATKSALVANGPFSIASLGKDSNDLGACRGCRVHGGLQIDHQLVLGEHFDRQLARLFPLGKAVNVIGGPSERLGEANAIGEQAADIDVLPIVKCRNHAMPKRKVRKERAIESKYRGHQYGQGTTILWRRLGKCRLVVVWPLVISGGCDSVGFARFDGEHDGLDRNHSTALSCGKACVTQAT